MHLFQLEVLLRFLGLCALRALTCSIYRARCSCCSSQHIQIQFACDGCTLYRCRNASSILLIDQEGLHTEDTAKHVSENFAGVWQLP